MAIKNSYYDYYLALKNLEFCYIVKFVPISILVLLLGYVLINEVIRYNARIPKLPGPPGLPVVGNLLQTYGKHAPEIFRQWSGKYGDVYQIQFGNVPIIIINSASSAKELLQHQGHAFISRPIFYTFHKIVSGSHGFSIGTSPWDESCKRRRKAAATALNKPKVESYVNWLEIEVRDFIKEIYTLRGSPAEISTIIYRLALNMTMTVNYGDRIAEADSDFFKEINHVEKRISHFRATNDHLQNYIPILRLWKWRKENTEAKDIGRRRRQYNDILLNSLYDRIENGTDKSCIQGNISKDEESHLDSTERYSISISMIAGADSSVPTLLWAIAYLGHHPEIQEKIHKSILGHYKNAGDTVDSSDYSIDYIKAFISEVLRHYTVFRLNLPRATHAKTVYDGVTIPTGVAVFVNQWACNHDPEVYKNPFKFDVNRWLDKSNNLTKGISMGHFSFGAGQRMCPAAHLASRMLYMTILHLVWGFNILPPISVETGEPISLHPIEGLKSPTALTSPPVDYNVRFVAREGVDFESYFKDTE